MPAPNPLLQRWLLPPWSDIRAEHLVPAINTIVAENRLALTNILASQAAFPTWDDLVLAVDETDARLAEASNVIATLDLVNDENPAWMAASAISSTVMQQYKAEKMNNTALFRAYQQLAHSPIARNFDDSRTAVLNKILRRFRLSGIELDDRQQRQLARINLDISALENLFTNRLKDASAAWTKLIDDVASLSGLSQATQDRLALDAQQAGKSGWLLRLDQITYQQVMTYAEDRALRKEYFLAFFTRASDQGPHAGQFDNGPVLALLLSARQRKARLLGYENFAQLSLATKMADSTDQVTDFLRRQTALTTPELESDTQALKAFALKRNMVELEPWDLEFLGEQFRQDQYRGALKDLKAYFPLDGTLRRLCLFCERLFGIRIVEQKVFDRWHDDVRLLEVSEHEQVVGYIYLDPYHRTDANDFAYTDVLKTRRRDAEGQVTHPVAILYANFTPGIGDQPCLLVHRDLRVLFHEFGHCLQHVLTRSPHHWLSSISRLGRDSGEFAGQMFEQWCLSRDFLLWLAAHYRTGARLSGDRVDVALNAIRTQTSWQTAQLLMTARFDFELHRSQGDGRSVQQVFEDIQREFPLIELPANCRFANSFDYLVTGYEASVYAYKWSGALASEAFTRFKRDGVFNVQTGMAFREAFFTPGDSRSLLESMKLFLGTTKSDQTSRLAGFD